jgi:hypothetical protein
MPAQHLRKDRSLYQTPPFVGAEFVTDWQVGSGFSRRPPCLVADPEFDADAEDDIDSLYQDLGGEG